MSWKKKTEIPKGGLDDNGISKAWGDRAFWNFLRQGGV